MRVRERTRDEMPVPLAMRANTLIRNAVLHSLAARCVTNGTAHEEQTFSALLH